MLFKIKYVNEINEMIQANLDFIENRPIVKWCIRTMTILSWLIIIGFCLKSTYYKPELVDILFCILAIGWIFFRRKLQIILIKLINKKKQSSLLQTMTVQVSLHKLLWYINSATVQEQNWKKVKYIYKNNCGYIIPRSSFKYRGQFIWLPFRAFNSAIERQKFLKLLKDLKLVIINI